MNKRARGEQKVRQEMLAKQISSLRFLLRQGLAVKGHEDLESNLFQLLQLRSSDCSDLAAPTIINKQIALMGLSVLRSLLVNIREAEWFSLIVDEATDVSNKEQLALGVRWVDKDLSVNEDSSELVHVLKTDSNTLTHVLKDCLVCSASLFHTAEAKHMMGPATWALEWSICTNRKGCPNCNVCALSCSLHKFVLATVGRQCTLVRNALDLVMGLSQLICQSPKCTTLFLSLQTQFSPNNTMLKPLCPLQWTVRNMAISAALKNYDVLCTTLEEVNATTHNEYR